MSEVVRINIPAAVAAYVTSGTSRESKLQAASGDVALQPADLIILLFCLHKDADFEVRNRATNTLKMLPDAIFSCLSGWDELHPAILHLIGQLCGERVQVRNLVLQHPATVNTTKLLLAEYASKKHVVITPKNEIVQELLNPEPASQAILEPDEEEAECNEESDEYLSKYKLVQVMGTAEKIKMALTGDKEWRKILIKDSNKLVSSGVLKNPRITEPEVLNVLKSGAQNDEIMRLICANKEWTKNYQIRKALIENPKTPLANALRYLSSMNEKDIAGYAKSRNISSVIATQAKRLLLNKKRQ